MINKGESNKVSTAIATQTEGQDFAAVIERVVTAGDLSKLSATERVNYYNAVCRSIGVNPLTQPLQFISLNGKLVLYARRECTDQLRSIHGVSITKLETTTNEGVFEVLAHARNKDGREDADMGAASIAGLKGDPLVNAKLKAITKAKRRVTLSICGLGFLDETEVATIPDAMPVEVNLATGEIEAPKEVKKPNGNGREKIIQTVTDLDNLIRELRSLGVSNADIQARMQDLVGVNKRADLNEGQMVACIEEFEDWAARLELDRKGIN